MKVIQDIRLEDFEAWSGGKDTIDNLTTLQLRALESILEDLYPEGMTDTQLNDILWFEKDAIANWLGYKSYDHLLGYDEEEEEEEEEEDESNDEC